jgi:hypothetical protein
MTVPPSQNFTELIQHVRVIRDNFSLCSQGKKQGIATGKAENNHSNAYDKKPIRKPRIEN